MMVTDIELIELGALIVDDGPSPLWDRKTYPASVQYRPSEYPMVSPAERADAERGYRADRLSRDETYRAGLAGLSDADLVEIEYKALRLATLDLMAADPNDLSGNLRRSAEAKQARLERYEAKALVAQIPEELVGKVTVMAESTFYEERRASRAVESMRPSKRVWEFMIAEAEAAGVVGSVPRCGHCGVVMGGKQATAQYCGQTCRKAANRAAKRVTP